MTDHATVAELLANDHADIATAHALLAIAEQLADIAQRLPSRQVVNDQRAEVQPPAHPGGFVECIQSALLAHGYTASPDREGDQ